MNKILALFFTMASTSVFATTWYVAKSGSDSNTGKASTSAFVTIQKAIDSASTGDEIVVSDGTYATISTANKRIKIRSVNGAHKTIIDGGGSARCATLGSDLLHTNTVLRGFTLQNGKAQGNLGGGGVFAGSVYNCIIKNNKAGHQSYSKFGNGGGARGGRLYQCIISGNSLLGDTTAYHSGGGVSEATMFSCTVANNSATASQCSVGGAYKCVIYNSIIVDNKGNCTLQDSTAICCCIPISDSQGNGNSVLNCVTGSPLFLDSQNSQYYLLKGSPCIDSGNGSFMDELIDLAGKPRIVGAAIDMGVYEWYEGSPSVSIDVDGTGSYETTWYVTKSGNDSNTGKSESAAFLTIQKAIDTAAAGDRIIVSDGTYDPISTANKKLRIESKNGAGKTIINGANKNRCATLGSAVTHRSTTLKGFTLQNGYVAASLGGGGSFGGTLINCLIKNCWSDEYGNGGGVRGGWLYQCIVTGCGLKHNASNTDNYLNGGGATEARLINCVVANNDTTSDYHLSVSGASNCQLENTIVADNKGRDATQMSSCSAVNSCVPDTNAAASGNTCSACVTTSPMFVDSKNANYRLLAGSPCVDSGSLVYALGTKDYAGKARVVGAGIDIGAYEWYEGSPSVSIDVDGTGSYGTTWYVTKSGNDSNTGKSESAAFLTIQKAIDTAAAGDRIIVSDGTYDPISTANKKLRIESKNGAGKTIINGANKNRCATLGSAVTHRSTTLKGFTLQNGYVAASLGGGGSFGGTLINCLIKNCWSDEYGNGGGARGGWLYQCIITGCGLKHDASNTDNYLNGGGANEARLINCVIANNDTTSNYHLSVSGASSCQLENTIVADNKGRDATQVSSCSAVNCCLPATDIGANGNSCVLCVSGSPMFLDTNSANYNLLAGSPCIDAGSPAFKLGAYDYAGRTRLYGSAIDIGPYEWSTSSPSISKDVEGKGPFGTIWYVTKSGNDSNTGKSESAAFLTIQKAIDTAAAGDKIIVSDGTYSPITTANKKLWIESKNGATKTKIDGGGTTRCATLGSALSHVNTTLKGFTLQNGRAQSNLGGGGSFAGFLINCRIQGNKAGHQSYSNYGHGGGARGGWLYQCLVTGNSLMGDTTAYHSGGGVSEATVVHCTIANNSATASQCSVGGAYKCVMYNTIIADNTGNCSLQECTLVYCCLPKADDSVNGNTTSWCITGSPMMLDSRNGDYRLLSISPCVDAASTAFAWGSTDYAGKSRKVGASVDMGVYEWYEGSPSVSIDVDGTGSYGTTWYVTKSGNDSNTGKSESAAFLTIQKAIDTAAAGDRIIVSDGTYDPISTANKKLRIESKNGAGKTIINGANKNRCATLGSAVTHRSTTLKGFTLQNGYVAASLGGGGSFGGMLINCLIKNCWSDEYGNGGGVRGGWLYQCIITGCGLKHNASNTDNYLNGGGATEARLINCVVANNDTTSDYHLSVSGASSCQLENTIVAGNRGRNAVQMSNCSAVNSCVPAGDSSTSGNSSSRCVTASPMFIDIQAGNYGLMKGSPCIDAGSDVYALGAKDYNGKARIVGASIDIGAFEWYEGSPTFSLDVEGKGPFGTTWYVTKSGNDSNTGKSESAAFLTIQKAIDTATAGDKIIVSDGTYSPISTANKKLWIESKNGLKKAIIDGGGTARCATLGSSVTQRSSVLKGFTLQNGRAEGNVGGGGSFAGLLINCWIKNNKAGHQSYSNYGDGGGARGGWLYQCVVSGNTLLGDTTAYHNGGGVTEARLIQCTIVNNSATASQCSVGGAYRCELDNCVVANNLANGGANLYLCNAIASCIPLTDSTSTGNACYRCITSAPMVADLSNGDFHLVLGSPCVDAGDNQYALGSKDFDGAKRIFNSTVDMGAYELQLCNYELDVVATYRFPWDNAIVLGVEVRGESSASTIAGTVMVCDEKSSIIKTISVAFRVGSNSVLINRAVCPELKIGKTYKAIVRVGSTAAESPFVLKPGRMPWEKIVPQKTEVLLYSSKWTSLANDDAKAVVKVMPVMKTKPKYLVIDVSGGTTATKYPISYLDEVPGGSWSDEYKTSKLVLRHIPAGSFIMGGRNTDYPGAVNTNLHMVTITKDFYMGVFEVTQRQWELVMGNRPSQFTNETCYATRPVDKVSYLDIRGSVQGAAWPLESGCDETSFIGVLSAKSGLSGIDLPTDAQWEYACRAGTSTALNTGKNISTAQDVLVCPELMADARFTGNSNNSNMTNPERFACTDEYCSAKVGSYTPNNWGLYDMHGNLWELCLDRAAWLATGEVDPIGIDDESITKRIIRGGGYNELAWRCSSGFRYSDTAGMGYNQTGRGGTVGFRLCLQGGDVPDFAAASALVNAAGNGSQSWTPTKAGAYYLTHSTMNGATNAQLLSAWFEVPGCQLTLEPQGELTNGVMMAINGATAGWTVYYTTNGLAPSKTSEKYTGPFSLPESATVRAVAYNAEGLEGEEVSETYTLHDALNVKSAVAHQRYPWNGKVDVDCEFVGDTNKQYGISLTAVDTAGNTNLPMATAWVEGTAITNTSFSLKPGKHRLVWDADADIAQDADYEAVAVKIASIDTEIKGVSAQDAASLTSGIVVSWQTNADAEKYKVYRVVEDGDDLMVGESTGNSFEDKTLPAAGTYSYYVRGVFGGKDGPASKVCAASCVRMPVCDDPLIYLPLDGNVNNYGSVPCTFGKYTEDAAWLWLENRFNEEGLANYLGVNNRIAFPSSESFCVSSTFSVAFWAKSESVLSQIVEERASGNYGVIGAKYPYVLYPNHGGDYGQSGLGIAVGTNGVAVVEHAGGWFPATLVFAGNIGSGWNHFVVTMSNNGAAILYVNGVKVRTGLVSEKVKKITNANLGGSANYGKYVGYVDDFMIYGRALSADEVRDLYRWDDPHVSDVRRVVFDPNGGSFEGLGSTDPRATNLIERIYIGESATYGALPVVSKTGALFKGWGIAKTSDTYIKASDPVPANGGALYAIWDDAPLYMVVDLSGGSAAKSYPVSYLSGIPSGGWTDMYKTTSMVLRYVSPRKFKMNGQYNVTLTKGYYIGIFQVTQKQYELVTGAGVGQMRSDLLPAEYLSYNQIRGASLGAGWPNSSDVDATSILGVLRSKTSLRFDLPTEAQWECACRGNVGANSIYNNGGATENDLKLLGRYSGNNGDGKGSYGFLGYTIVGQYEPNDLGIYDMHGNVWEWVLDYYAVLADGTDPKGGSSGSRVVRGGSWSRGAGSCTSSSREAYPSYYNFSDQGSWGSNDGNGFRVCVTVE